METTSSPSSISFVKCCDCGCSCSVMSRSLSGSYLRSVKRKYDESEEENLFRIPDLVMPQNARVEIGNECALLREMVGKQQLAIQDLCDELEEERNASASAADEAMSMILRLQTEKAEIQMEAKQYKRYTEEKIGHDEQEILIFEDLLYKREQAIQSLMCEIQAYKHRMMSYGLTEIEAEGERSMSRNNSLSQSENFERQYEFPHEIYPPLKCNLNSYAEGDDASAEKGDYPFNETPRSHGQLKDLEYRIDQLERSPRNIHLDGANGGTKNLFEKVIVGQSPRRFRNLSKFASNSSNSLSATAKETGSDLAMDSPKLGYSFKKMNVTYLEENTNSRKAGDVSEDGLEFNDRVYTIDSVDRGASPKCVTNVKAFISPGDDFMSTPREYNYHTLGRDIEIQKLYARLHALEVDRESMRQTIISMGTDKAQMVLLKEIAQNLYKEMSPARTMAVKKQSKIESYSFLSVFKWITSFVFWRRRSQKCRYKFGLSAHNTGLLILLDRSLQLGRWRCTRN